MEQSDAKPKKGGGIGECATSQSTEECVDDASATENLPDLMPGAGAKEGLTVAPDDDLVDVMFGKPTVEVPVGDRETRYWAIQRVVRKFKESGQTYRAFAGYLAVCDLTAVFGFPKRETVSKDKLQRWVTAKSEQAYLDKRFYNRRRRMVADAACALVIQIMRADANIQPAAVLRRLEMRQKEEPALQIVLPKMGSLKSLMKFLKEHDIPQRLNAASRGSFFKEFGIRVEHGWEYSNQTWQTDSAQSRISTWARGEIIKPHVVAVVDCYSSLVMFAEMFDHYPTAKDCLWTFMMAVLPKSHPAGFNYGGYADTIRFDQHGQFHSPIYMSPIDAFGIETEPIPVGQSVNDGKVERHFRTFRSNFEADFPNFLKARRRFINPDTLQYVGDFATLRKEFHEWVDVLRFIPSREDNMTPYDRWHSGLRSGDNPFPDNIVEEVRNKIVLKEPAEIDDNCVVYSKEAAQSYSSPALADLQGRKVTLSVSLMRPNPVVRAILRGHDLGVLRPTSEGCDLANDVSQAGLESIEKAYNAQKTLNKWIGGRKQQSPRHNKTLKTPAPSAVAGAIKLYRP